MNESIIPTDKQPEIDRLAPNFFSDESVPATGSFSERLRQFPDRAIRLGKQIGLRAIIAFEVFPATNEGSRYGALTVTELATHNPVAGAAVLGGATLLIEGSAALATAPLVSKEKASRVMDWVNKRISKKLPGVIHIPRPVEAAIALSLGTPATMIAKQLEKPARTTAEVRRHGLAAAGLMSSVFAAEGALISEGVANYTDPRYIGAAALSAGVILAAPGLIKKKFERQSGESVLSTIKNVVSVSEGGHLNAQQLEASISVYDALRRSNDEGIKVGLYGEDLEKALSDPTSLLIEYERGHKGKIYMPLLVPAERLTWYNMELLKKTYGDKNFYYYAHPLIPDSEPSRQILVGAMQSELDAGSIILMDRYEDRQADPTASLIGKLSSQYELEKFGGGGVKRKAEIYVGEGTAEGLEIKKAPSFYDTYLQAVTDGEVPAKLENGVSVAETIIDEDAEHIWEIYKKPFDDLSEEHPMYAGFSKEDLMDILRDPTQTKIVNRVDGKISTLCLFVSNFDRCPWFNEDYYKNNYPEYHNSDNIYMFPGIVTDETMRGGHYSLDLLDLITKLFVKRGSNILVTFECTETSAQYIPKIVTFAISHNSDNKGAKMTGLEESISTMDYVVLKKPD